MLDLIGRLEQHAESELQGFSDDELVRFQELCDRWRRNAVWERHRRRGGPEPVDMSIVYDPSIARMAQNLKAGKPGAMRDLCIKFQELTDDKAIVTRIARLAFLLLPRRRQEKLAAHNSELDDSNVVYLFAPDKR